MRKWISVKDSLPEEHERVLIWWKENNPADGPEYYALFGKISSGHWRPEGGYGNFDDRVSHWMREPAPPKEKE